MTHVMLDLETLSTRANARIIAIGAVAFDQDKGVYAKFYQPIVAGASGPLWDGFTAHMQTHADEEGFHISKDTLRWWDEQSDEAKRVFTDPNACMMNTALDAFDCWLGDLDDRTNIRVWGNGASFDNTILATAYSIMLEDLPWRFYNDRCYRTAKNLYPNVALDRIGVYHNAMDDAETQAMHLLKMPVVLN